MPSPSVPRPFLPAPQGAAIPQSKIPMPPPLGKLGARPAGPTPTLSARKSDAFRRQRIPRHTFPAFPPAHLCPAPAYPPTRPPAPDIDPRFPAPNSALQPNPGNPGLPRCYFPPGESRRIAPVLLFRPANPAGLPGDAFPPGESRRIAPALLFRPANPATLPQHFRRPPPPLLSPHRRFSHRHPPTSARFTTKSTRPGKFNRTVSGAFAFYFNAAGAGLG